MITYLQFDNKEQLDRAKRIGIYFDHQYRRWYTTDINMFRKLEAYYEEHKYTKQKKKPRKKLCYEKGYKKKIKNNAWLFLNVIVDFDLCVFSID